MSTEPPRPPTVLSVQPVAERGGSDQALLRMARQLSAAGWDVHVALPAPSPMAAEFASAGVTLHVVPMPRISTSHGATAWLGYALNWPKSVLTLRRLSRSVQADVVHSNSLHSWYGWAAAGLAGKPHIWHAREIVVQSRSALLVERFLALHFARRVLAISEAVASQLHRANLTVVHEEADPAEFYPGRAGRARRKYGLPDDALVVGYVGRIDTWKGVDVLLDSVPRLWARVGGEGVRVVIAGGTVGDKETYAGGLRQNAEELGVLWLGPLSGEDAGDLIADLDCLVLPSTEPEPWGLVLVEALACGTPVVATDAGGAREILAGLPPDAGRLVPPRDATALATAVATLLPATTTTAQRRARQPLRAGEPAPYVEIFEEVAGRRPHVAGKP
ncbi:MAG TPA: glycosyltransferase family 4 protein [Acidimicrobiales bacterium]|nr:glycosyltransferase family 4 protein [Acidimicrobiales bacterium]